MTDKANTNTTTAESEPVCHAEIADLRMNQDLKHSILIVSVLANLVVLTGWIALQVTTQYDAQIATMLFAR